MTDTLDQILDQNAKKIEEIGIPKPIVHPDSKILPEVKTYIQRTVAVINPIPYKSKLLEAKKEYLTDMDSKPVSLAKKYGIDPLKLQQIMKEENWDKQRLSLYIRADEKARQIMESTLAEVKSRHILIGNMLQKLGQKSIRKAKPILNPRDSLEYITEGVRIEREAYGMDRQSPKIVNIIAQQQKVIQKYKDGPKTKKDES